MERALEFVEAKATSALNAATLAEQAAATAKREAEESLAEVKNALNSLRIANDSLPQGAIFESLKVVVFAHIQNVGNVIGSNCVGLQTLRIEGIAMKLEIPDRYNHLGDARLEYRAHLQDIGDTEWSTNMGYVGHQPGLGKRLESFAVRVVGENAGSYHVRYRARDDNLEWHEGADGEPCGTTGQCLALNLIEVRVEFDLGAQIF